MNCRLPFSHTNYNNQSFEMSQRIDTTKWIWYFLVVSASPFWIPARGVTVKTPPTNPSTVQAQAKFFQYRHLPTSEDFDQGHRLGSDRHFTERHERSRPSAGLFSAKVRWGDKKGGYGEHYWDLNHAGHTGNHDNEGYNDSDDHSYHDSSNDPYDEPSDHSPSYSNDDYDPEKSSYEENGRAKRAHPKTKLENRRPQKEYYDEHEQEKTKPRKQNRKNAEQLETAPSHKVEEYSEEEEDDVDILKKTPKRRSQNKQTQQEQYQQPKEQKNQVVLVVKENDNDEAQPKQYARNIQKDASQYVPYEGGAGVRQHHQPDLSAAAVAPRLFLEHATGRVVDRATGQAYILQPILNYQ